MLLKLIVLGTSFVAVYVLIREILVPLFTGKRLFPNLRSSAAKEELELTKEEVEYLAETAGDLKELQKLLEEKRKLKTEINEIKENTNE